MTLQPNQTVNVWATSFHASTLERVGPSVDSHFESLDQVIEAMGNDFKRITRRLIIYGNTEDRIAFSDYPFYTDEIDNKE